LFVFFWEKSRLHLVCALNHLHRAEITLSDHRPVSAYFRIEVFALL
jgi:hypothetical protein